MIGGIADIDVDDWKKHTDYRGYTENDEVISNFWKVSKVIHVYSLKARIRCFLGTDADLVNFIVYSRLGCRAEVSTIAICYRNFTYTGTRFQGFAGQRWAKKVHD